MNYATIDRQMQSKNQAELVLIAKSNGFKYFSEMIHDLHRVKNQIPAKIAKMLYNANGKQLMTKTGVYNMLSRNQWLIRQHKTKLNIEITEQPTCICCGRVPKHPDLHRLCKTCYTSNGHNTKGAQGGNCNPHGEYSNGANMVSWGQA